MIGSLVIATVASAEPITTAEAKAFMRIPSAYTTDDTLIGALIDAAIAEIDGKDGWLGRAVINQVWDWYLDAFPAEDVLYVPLPPLTAVGSITYTDTAGAAQTWATANYTVDLKSEPGRITPAYGVVWPSTRDVVNAVTVRFTAGWANAAAVPETIKTALKALVLDYYSNPSELEEKRHGDTWLTYRREGSHFPPHVRRLLSPYKVWR